MDLDTVAFVSIQLAVVAFVIWQLVRWKRARRRFAGEAEHAGAIAHWRVLSYEWARFCEDEAARIWRRDLPRLMLRFAGPAAFFVAFCWYLYDPAKHVMFDLRLGAVLLMGAIGALLVAYMAARALGFLRERACDYEVYVRPRGLHEVYRRHGEIEKSRDLVFGADLSLAAAALEKAEHYSYLALTLRGDRGGTAQKRIPVPRGQERQAEAALAKLRALAGG